MLKQFASGNALPSFVECNTPMVPTYDAGIPLTFVMIVRQKGNQVLLHHNLNRRQWECAAGGIEKGETPEEAAVREVLEETCQPVIELKCCGVFKLKLAHSKAVEYGALHSGTVDTLREFEVNNESDRITLWQPDAGLRRPQTADSVVLRED